MQLCVPEIYGREVLSLCHEQLSGHVSTTRSKDRVLRCYF